MPKSAALKKAQRSSSSTSETPTPMPTATPTPTSIKPSEKTGTPPASDKTPSKSEKPESEASEKFPPERVIKPKKPSPEVPKHKPGPRSVKTALANARQDVPARLDGLDDEDKTLTRKRETKEDRQGEPTKKPKISAGGKVCDSCGQAFADVDSLTSHLLAEHNDLF